MASPVLVAGGKVIPFATNGEGGILVATLVVSSPNTAGTKDTSRDTTDISMATEKENETFNIAWGFIETNCKTATTVVDNSMWLHLWPCHVDEHDKLVVAMVDCNWNTWDEEVASEITHNIL